MVGTAAASGDDRRTGDLRHGKRHSTVLLIGKVRHGAGAAACLVHDISRRGLMARFTVALSVGETIRVEVRGLAAVDATVRWVDGLRAGVEFAVPQDLAGVFCLRDARGLVARSPRFAVACCATMRIADRPMVVELVDISSGGAKLRADRGVQPGQAGWIALPGTSAPSYGTVCWSGEERFGFRFVRPLPLADLARLVGGSAVPAIGRRDPG